MRFLLLAQPVVGESGTGWKIAWGDPTKRIVVVAYPPDAEAVADEVDTLDTAVAFLAEHGVDVPEAARTLIGG